jgi:transcription elongation GreA/GreB family factor
MRFDKKKLLQRIIQEIQKDLDILVRSAIEAREAATHSESKQEGKYDTRGLEASYLASGQARRAQELEELIHTLKNIEPSDFSDQTPIRSTALIELSSDNSNQDVAEKIFIFLVPKGGGLNFEHQGFKVKIIACNSPLGAELLGRLKGEVFTFKTSAQNTKDYEILNVT